jgi:plasmid stabilization system protein ParE
MTFKVRWGAVALADLDRLHEFLLTRATCAEDLELASRAIDEIRDVANSVLAQTPYTCRKASNPRWRELIIPFGKTGYIARFRIEPNQVTVLAVRHQREEDYH